MKKNQKGSYSVQFKQYVLSFMKRTGLSVMDTALHFGITNPSLIASWKKAFNEGGAEALEKPKGRPPMSDKAKKNKITNEKELTHEQRLERENELLRLEVEYLKKCGLFR
ncbi:helix-turn-helix domain-containing protein [Metabacillus sp. FJAT-52054]|uniref:Helix-turn-helix domain-containing protein n=1 Tax=Metabacillus sediminis TaxID=3117746 RepID=A0ABZ2NET0_9BACI